jgi:peptidoglycan/LPS O-acetylase OafA/YrhL
VQYRAEIDGLRALAVLPVILFHAGFAWFSGGFVGVDVFFVISGYLITTIIISEMAEGKFSIVNFYERRARRILPALFFVMAACLPFAWLWLTPNDLKDFGNSLVAVSTFSSNILFWLESGYFDTAAELKPLLHTWSLAVEEQYYILFPIFLMLTWRLGIKWVLVLLSVVFLLSLGIAQWGAYNATTAAFFLLPTRGWELLVGVFAAFYLKYNTHLKSLFLNQILSLLGFGMITYSIIAFDKTTPFPSLYALIPTIGTGLLILCAVPKTYIHKLLSLKFIVGIGLISYSAYLWHQPLLAFARHRILGDVSDLILIILCVASLAMAWFSWRFVEQPFRSRTHFSRNLVFRFSILGIFIFSLIGSYITYSTDSSDSSDRWYKGLDGWLFLGNQYNQTVSKSQLLDIPSVNKINRLKRTFNDISIVAEKSNTQIALIVGPNKSSIYFEKLPAEMFVSPTRYVDFFLNELTDISYLNIYDPMQDLINSKKSEGPLYDKTDTHWNDKGAYIAFKNLLSKLGLDAPDVSFSIEESPAGDLVAISEDNLFKDLLSKLGLDAPDVSFSLEESTGDDLIAISEIKEPPINYGDTWAAEIKHAHKLARIKDNNIPSTQFFGANNKVINSNPYINSKIWIIGDSFTTALKPYFEATFSEVTYLGHWQTELDVLASKLDDSVKKPDLIVVVRVERSF